jgi:hypothetical protein
MRDQRCTFVEEDGFHHCGSYAFNLQQRDIDQGTLCDVHYWESRSKERDTYINDLKDERDQLGAQVRELEAHHCEAGLENPDAMLAHMRSMQPIELKFINQIFTGRR